MADPERRVRQLRLAAPDADAVRRLLPRLEDALRCASLPDQGQRLLLVRRLALGSIPQGVSAQALAMLIERRVAQAERAWVTGGRPEAAGADCVAFASAFEARLQLALRLLAGRPAAEWYWPRAVPEFAAAQGRGANLRAIARTLAGSPTGRAALPAWLARLVHAGHVDRLVVAIPPAEGEALLRSAGIAATEQPVGVGSARRVAPATGPSPPSDEGAVPGSPSADPAPSPRRARPLPAWLQRVLATQGAVPAAAPATRCAAAASDDAADRDRPALFAAPMPSPRARRHRHAGPAIDRPARAAPIPADPAMVEGPAVPPVSRRVEAARRTARRRPASRARAERLRGAPYLDESACAGLCFLLPVLTRLGLDGWSDDPVRQFAQRVLRAALERLAAPPDDPAWAIVDSPAPAAALTRPAPTVWQHAALAPPRRRSGPLAEALARAPDADAQARVWLDAARRWLRRVARIGLASLVRRTGYVALTPTHVDLHFRLRDTELRIRRAGLDIDPGWLPWFGRVVAFHYGELLR